MSAHWQPRKTTSWSRHVRAVPRAVLVKQAVTVGENTQSEGKVHKNKFSSCYLFTPLAGVSQIVLSFFWSFLSQLCECGSFPLTLFIKKH